MLNTTSTSHWEFLSTGYHDLDLFLHSFFGIYHPQLLFAQAWLFMENHYTEFQICVWGSLLVQAAGYVFTSIPAFLFQFIPSLQSYKIQSNRPLTLKEQLKCVNMVLFSHTCIFVPLMIFLYYATRPFNIPYDYASMPRWFTFFPICFFCLVVEDTWHYWLHRGLHHPAIYGRIHKMHHTFASPFPWAAEYAHPIETMVLGAGFFAPLPFVCSHLSIFYMWLFVRSMQSTDAHAGYSIYWNPLNLLPFYGGAEFHDYHHRAFNGNYASSFRWWDWYCGTDVDYNKFQANKKMNEAKQVKQE